MGHLTALIVILVICAGPSNALPIAAVRPNINFNITLPPATTPQTFVSNRSRDEVFTDVARIMKAAKGSPFRYGKRSVPPIEMSAGGILDNPFLNFNDVSKAYTVSPVYEVGLYKNPYSAYFYRKPVPIEKPRAPPSFPFPGYFPQFLESMMFKDRILRMDRLFKTPVPEAPSNSRAELDKLFQMLTVMERAEKDETLHDINQFYQSSTLTRPRPGKRAVFSVPQKMDKVLNEFKEAVVFSNPQGKRSADKASGKTTVVGNEGVGGKNRCHAPDKAQGQ